MAHDRKRTYSSRKMRSRNDQGIALLELILAISVGVLVSIAVTTVMLMGFRIFDKSSDAARDRNQVLSAVTIMEKLVAENTAIGVVQGTDSVEICAGGDVLLTYDASQKTVFNGQAVGGTPILEDVEKFNATLPGSSLLCVTMTVKGEEYSLFLLARDLVSQTGGASLGAQALLNVLKTQLGSDGRIVVGNENGILNYGDTPTYFSEWYIGDYDRNEGWNENTPWCACFVSWGLQQCEGYIVGNTPRYASVNTFREAMIRTGSWESADYTPQPGDLIFFDWPNAITGRGDGVLDHVGVVESVDSEYVYTIEGNSSNQVREQNYRLSSGSIAGYGRINWIN